MKYTITWIFFLLPFIAYAQSPVSLAQISLTPTTESKFELLSIEAEIFEDGSVRIHGKNELSIHNPQGLYHLDVDITNATYTTTPYTAAEKVEFEARNNTNRKSSSALTFSDETNQAAFTRTTQALATYYTAYLYLLSEDGVWIDLCQTKGTVSWVDNGVSVTATTTSAVFTPFNPTAAFTHWFLESSYGSILYGGGIPQPYNRAWAGATYYNWDFPPVDEKTSIDHWISLEFFPKLPNGIVGYYDFDAFTYGQNEWFTRHTFSWNLTNY